MLAYGLFWSVFLKLSNVCDSVLSDFHAEGEFIMFDSKNFDILRPVTLGWEHGTKFSLVLVRKLRKLRGHMHGDKLEEWMRSDIRQMKIFVCFAISQILNYLTVSGRKKTC